MDLNHINLPSSLMADFYKTSLFEKMITAPLAKKTEVTAENKKRIQFLGKNQKGICVLVNYPKDVYLPDEQLNFLTAILQACKLNMGDVAIVNYARENISFTELKTQITCNYLLIFGVKAADLGIDEMTLFSSQNISDCCVVYSSAAEDLNNNNTEGKILKSKLWNCLKQIFNV